MLTLQINAIRPIGSDCLTGYSGIACDGKFFYLTVTKCREIHSFDTSFNFKECYDVCRGYSSICYDKDSQCFWAVSPSECNKIFKLDTCMKEVDCIIIKPCNSNPITITGISCGKKCNNLLISCNTGIAQINKEPNTVPCFLQQPAPHCRFTSVQMLENCYISSACCNTEQIIFVFNHCNESLLQCHLTNEYKIEDMSLTCCACCNEPFIYILATKCGYSPYIMKCTVKCYQCCDKCESENNYCSTCECNTCHEKESYDECAKSKDDPCCNKCECNICHEEESYDECSKSKDDPCCNKCECNICHEKESCDECAKSKDYPCYSKRECDTRNETRCESCGSHSNDIVQYVRTFLNIGANNKDECCTESQKQCCNKCECNTCPKKESCNQCCKCPIDYSKSCSDIMESIALIQTALSHILNAEGEKIQKILCTSDSPCEILKVNEAVNKTIINVTQLEHVLYSKLQLTKDLCSEKCLPCPPPCNKDMRS